MDEEKEGQKETPVVERKAFTTWQVKEKLESEGFDPDEFDEDECEELADLLWCTAEITTFQHSTECWNVVEMVL